MATKFLQLLQRLLRCVFGVKDPAYVSPKIKPVEGSSVDYELLEDYAVFVPLFGWTIRLEILPGFVFDGASVPRLLWAAAGHPLLGPRLGAALVHDFLYRSQILSKREADLIYAKIMAQAGRAYWRILIEYLALVFCGQKSWDENAEKSTLAAATFGRLTYFQDDPRIYPLSRRAKTQKRKAKTMKKLFLMSGLALTVLSGCMRIITIEKNDPIVVNETLVSETSGWTVTYRNIGLKTDVDSIVAKRTETGAIEVKVNGIATDVSAENKEIVGATGTAVGNVAEKVVEAIKK